MRSVNTMSSLPQDADGVWFADGAWQSMLGSAQYAAKKSADRESYAWDELIEKFVRHITGGTLATGNEHPLSDHERGVRIMAGEGRLQRRNLIAALFNLLAITPESRTATRLVLSKQAPERAYRFLIRPHPEDETYDIYRERRTALLAAYCHVAKVRRPEPLDIIGIATEPIDVDTRSE